MTKIAKLLQQKILIGVITGFLIGVLWLVALRYFTYESDTVHYHANFALYVNGQKDEFDNFTFYEEVQSCGADDVNNPLTRVHMHDEVNDVVHVHANAATWGAFFANLGYSLGDRVLQTDDGSFVDNADGKQLRFILNGETVDGIANRTIKSEDRLLIDYGADNQEVLLQRYKAVEHSAAEYNQKTDPSSCSGTKPTTWQEKLKSSVGIN